MNVSSFPTSLSNFSTLSISFAIIALATAAGVAANMSKNPKIKAIGKAASEVGKGISNIAKKIGVDLDRISVKATTEEKLGFTGSGEGISAHAVCLIEK